MVENIAALDQVAFEEELGLIEAGWVYLKQDLEPSWAYGGGAFHVSSCTEVYKRTYSVEPDGPRLEQQLSITWVSPENISLITRDGKEYPHPTPEVIRMLVHP